MLQDVPDVTDLAAKVHQAADAVEAAAAQLKGTIGDAPHVVADALHALDGRLSALKQQVVNGEKGVEAILDEVRRRTKYSVTGSCSCSVRAAFISRWCRTQLRL